MILCAGESLIDMVPQKGAAGFLPLPGGAVHNTALALGRLEQAVGYLWPISRDGFGEMLIARLEAAGVDVGLCPRSDRPTALAFALPDGAGTRYSFYDDGSAGRMFAPDDLPELPGNLQALFIGGISLAADPCGATIERLAERAVAAGAALMLDPNIRPSAIRDEPAYRARLARLMARADIVKLSTEDLAWLRPGRSPDDTLLDEIRALGPGLVLHTRAEKGAVLRWRGGTIAAATPRMPLPVADTIGAGDVFNAGMLAALAQAGTLGPGLRGIDAATLRAALETGIRAASFSTTRPGADPPWLRELEDAGTGPT